MKIEDLIQLLSNRLREFKLSRDYSRMSGDLERMNTADKEIIGLEDTLYQLNLLVDVSKSAIVKENVLAEVITDGSVAVLGDYDITPYATDPLHERKIMTILSKMAVMDTAEKIDDYIKGSYLSSPITGEMVMSAALAYAVDVRLIMAIMQQDSSFGTAGLAVRTLNPGNVGNDDDGNIRTYESWQEGVTAVAEWLSRHRGSTPIPEIPEETVALPTATSTSSQPSPEATAGTAGQATSTPSLVLPTTSTTTPVITTSTTTTATTTPVTATSTPVTSATTSVTATSTPVITTSTDETIPVATSTPATTTSTAETGPAATSTPATTPSIEETIPVATSTPVIATSTPVITTSTTTTIVSTPNTAISTDQTIPVATSTPTTLTTPVVATSTAN